MNLKNKKYQSGRQILLNTLNNIDFSDKKLKDIKHYIKTKELPEFEAPYAEKKKERFVNLFVNKGYGIQPDGTLIYKPLNKEILSSQEKEKKLSEMYDDDKIGVGTGIKSFYNKVADKFVGGVGKTEVGKFLKDQTSYQLTKPEPKVVNKPIITRYPNERWQIDLIDVESYATKNRNYKYILTVIDNFSKYVFAIGLKGRSAETLLEGLLDIIENQAEHTLPRIIQSDNGGEFKNKIFQGWAKDNKITLKLSMSYQPTSNALIENFNNILRKMMREGFVRHNNLNWIDHLSNYLYNRNHSKHSTTGYQPDELWRVGRNKLKRTADSKVLDAQQRIKDKAKKSLDNYKAYEYEEGDVVRVLESSLYSSARLLLKANKGKLIIARYSPDLYRIAKVIKPNPNNKDAEFVRTRYFLYDKFNNIVETQLKNNDKNRSRPYKLFFASELQKIDKPPKKIISQDTTENWNQMEIEFQNAKEKELISDQPKVHQTRSQSKRDALIRNPPVKIHQTRSRK